MKGDLRIAAILRPAVAAAFGAGVGHLVGGIHGAAVACAPVGMAMLLGVAHRVSALTAARAVAAMVAVSGVGAAMDGVECADRRLDRVHAMDTRSLLSALAARSIRGAVRVTLPAAFFAAALSGRSRWMVGMVTFAGVLVALNAAGEWLVHTLPESVVTSIGQCVAPLGDPPASATVIAPWGGAVAVTVGVMLWVRFIWNDRLAFRLGLWGLVAGGVSFPMAWILGSFAAHLSDGTAAGPVRAACDMIASGSTRDMLAGLLWGAILGCRVWSEKAVIESTPDIGSLRLPWEAALLTVHATLPLAALFAADIGENSMIHVYGTSGVLSLVIPLICAFSGRRAPWLLSLPVVLFPVAGMAIRHGVYDQRLVSTDWGWIAIVAVPVAVALAYAAWASVLDAEHNAATPAAVPMAVGLIVEASLLLGMAAVLLEFSWPWQRFNEHTAILSILMGTVGVIGFMTAPSVIVPAGSDGKTGTA